MKAKLVRESLNELHLPGKSIDNVIKNTKDLDQLLIDSIKEKSLDLVKKVVEAGADVNTKDSNDIDVLEIALDCNLLDIAKYLLKQGTILKEVHVFYIMDEEDQELISMAIDRGFDIRDDGYHYN